MNWCDDCTCTQRESNGCKCACHPVDLLRRWLRVWEEGAAVAGNLPAETRVELGLSVSVRLKRYCERCRGTRWIGFGATGVRPCPECNVEKEGR